MEYLEDFYDDEVYDNCECDPPIEELFHNDEPDICQICIKPYDECQCD